MSSVTTSTSSAVAAAPADRLAAREGGGEVVSLAWHDVTCVEGPECRDRFLHARASGLVQTGVVHRFLELVGPGQGGVSGDVRAFHEAFDLPVRSAPGVAVPDRALRLRMLREELRELHAAVRAGDVVETLDALGDIVYLAHGDAHVYGLPLDAALAEIHASNMTKLGPDGQRVFRPDGKVGKNLATYRDPQLAPLVGQVAAQPWVAMGDDAPPPALAGHLDLWDADVLDTAASLDALGAGSVVVDGEGRSYMRARDGRWWHTCEGEPRLWDAGSVVTFAGPLRAVWVREAEDVSNEPGD